MKEFFITPIFDDNLSNLNQKNSLLQTNETSIEYGLALTEQEALMLIEAGKNSIDSHDRLEFGESATIKIVNKFMQSSYISQSEYADTIAELIDVFYQVKEECYDILTDDEVIGIMYDFFENESGGSIDILQTRDMDYLCKKIRYISRNITGDDYCDE